MHILLNQYSLLCIVNIQIQRARIGLRTAILQTAIVHVEHAHVAQNLTGRDVLVILEAHAVRGQHVVHQPFRLDLGAALEKIAGLYECHIILLNSNVHVFNVMF